MLWLLLVLPIFLLRRTWLRGYKEALVSLKSAVRLKRYGVHKTGEIIGFEERVDDEGDKWFYPIIIFLYQGKQWQFVSELGSSEKGLAGTYIRVIHDPLTPAVAEVDSLMSLFVGPIIALLFPIVFVALAVGYAIQEFLA